MSKPDQPRISLLAIYVLLVLASSGIEAQSERVLVPIFTHEPVAGAFGTRWIIDLTGFNASSDTVTVRDAPGPCALIPCPIDKFGSRSVFRPAISLPRNDFPLAYLYASPSDLDHIEFNLRVYDESRGFGDWGTQIPVVRESDAYQAHEAIHLLNVPVGPDFRTHVRVYSFDRINDPARKFEIRVFTMNQGLEELLRAREVFTVGIESLPLPGVSFVSDLFEGLEGDHDAVRVEIRPLEGSRPFWAFASITHNQTQHVTIVAPTLH